MDVLPYGGQVIGSPTKWFIIVIDTSNIIGCNFLGSSDK